MQPEDETPRRRRRISGDAVEGDTPLKRRRTRSAGNLDDTTETGAAASSQSEPKPRVRRTTPTTRTTASAAASDVPVSSASTAAPTAAAVAADSPADDYLLREVRRLRIDRNWSIGVGVGLLLVAGITLGNITTNFEENLQPAAAAQTANYLINQRVNEGLPQFKTYVREQLPQVINQIPDYAKEQLPKYREQLENQLQSSLEQYAVQTKPMLASHLDTFLDENRVAVGQLLSNSQDEQAMKALKPALKTAFYQYLNEAQLNGETLQQKIGDSLQAIRSVDETLKHLASNQGLTENEKRARRAIAILMLKVDENRDTLGSVRDQVQNLDTSPIVGTLQWQNGDEGTFTVPGQPPVAIKRVKPATSGAGSDSAPKQAQKQGSTGKGSASTSGAKSQPTNAQSK